MIAATLTCPDCGAAMALRMARQGRFAGRPFYGCTRYPLCGATHGAHPDGKPLGIPGDRATKAARIRAHQSFDLIWQSRMMSRKGAYAWMRHRLGMTEDDAHIGRFDVAACERLIAALTPLRLDDAEVTAARLVLKQDLDEMTDGWEQPRSVWRTVARILGVEGKVYLIELSAVQCEQVIARLRASEHSSVRADGHDRMRHVEHGYEATISGSLFRGTANG